MKISEIVRAKGRERESPKFEAKNSSFSRIKQYLNDPEDFANALKVLIGYLEHEEGLSSKEIIKLIKKEKEPKKIDIPSYIFNNKLSALETIVKYLKENLNLK